MPGDTTQTFAPAMKNNYGSAVVRRVRQKRNSPVQTQNTGGGGGGSQGLSKVGGGASPNRAQNQQNSDRVRDSIRLKPWL